MATALITTTIHVPKVLQLYRNLGPNVEIYVAGDMNTPPECADFCRKIKANYLSLDDQSHWKTSKCLGYNTITRRNLALLQALNDGADKIVTIDDDNIPLSSFYFGALQDEFCGLMASTPTRWFDYGQYLVPPIPQRGFPATMASDAVLAP